ncbi:MAG: YceD family protein [Azoarcus sp.]|nr:YceD family protein [Azoarcus sp.]
MSNQDSKPGYIADVFKFAAEQRSLSGRVEVAAMQRLADQLADTAGAVEYRIEGSREPESGPRLLLKIDGRLMLRCQRCLSGLGWDLTVSTLLQPVRAGQEIPDDELEDDEVDAIEVGDDLDVLGLIEDEILLALPIAPRHDECESPRPDGGAEKKSPFAVLSGLRGNDSAV